MTNTDISNNNVYVFEFQVDSVRLYESPLMQKLKLIKEEESREVEAEEGDEEQGDEEGEPPSDVERDAQFAIATKENVEFEMHNMVKTDKEVDDEAEENYANTFIDEQEVEATINNAIGDLEVVDYNEDDENENEEFDEIDDLDEYQQPEAEPVDLNAKYLKVAMTLYDITEFEIVEENFVENINKVIAGKDETGMTSASLASSILTANYTAQASASLQSPTSKTTGIPATVNSEIVELKKKSFCRVTTALRPAKMIRKIIRKPLYIRLYVDKPNDTKPIKLIGVSELKLDQSFINTIMTANTAAVVPQSVSMEETLPVFNALDEHIADVKILFRMACFGRIPWPECPDSIVRNKENECTVVMCNESDDSDVYLKIEDQ